MNDREIARAVMIDAETHLNKLRGKRNKAQSKVTVAEKALEKARAEYRRLSIPEPERNGAVVTFERTLHGRRYSYAAIKANGHFWYVTGSVAERMTWSKLLEWIGDEPNIFRVTGTERVR